jgi:hypothetical protein
MHQLKIDRLAPYSRKTPPQAPPQPIQFLLPESPPSELNFDFPPPPASHERRTRTVKRDGQTDARLYHTQSLSWLKTGYDF